MTAANCVVCIVEETVMQLGFDVPTTGRPIEPDSLVRIVHDGVLSRLS